MKRISGFDAGLPAYDVDGKLFVGPNSEEGVAAFNKAGVKLILSVLPKENFYAKLLGKYARQNGIRVFYFKEENYRTHEFSLVVARKAFELAKTQKIAVCCIAGSFSGNEVRKAYLKLKKQELFSLRKNKLLRAKGIVVRRILRKAKRK